MQKRAQHTILLLLCALNLHINEISAKLPTSKVHLVCASFKVTGCKPVLNSGYALISEMHLTRHEYIGYLHYSTFRIGLSLIVCIICRP